MKLFGKIDRKVCELIGDPQRNAEPEPGTLVGTHRPVRDRGTGTSRCPTPRWTTEREASAVHRQAVFDAVGIRTMDREAGGRSSAPARTGSCRTVAQVRRR